MTTLLIVDDESDFVAVLEILLSMEGYHVITAHDGEDAVAKAVDGAPDLVITDWMMPKMDGLELSRHLRERPDTARMPIILISALDMQPDQWAHFDVALRKPVKFETLLQLVRDLLERSRERGVDL